MYQIQVTGMTEVTKGMQNASKAFDAIMERALNQSLTAVTNMAKQNAPYKSGNLRRSITNEPLGKLRGIVTANTPYAKYVEVGTAPHTIVPKRAKVLAFKSGGSMVFTKKVNHPGFSGRFYMKRTTVQGTPIVQRYFSDAVKQFVRLVGNGGRV